MHEDWRGSSVLNHILVKKCLDHTKLSEKMFAEKVVWEVSVDVFFFPNRESKLATATKLHEAEIYIWVFQTLKISV